MYLLPVSLVFAVFPYLIFSANKPLRQRLRTIKECDLPASAYDPQGRILISTKVWTVGRRSFVNGTIFIAKKTLPIKYFVKGFKVNKDRRKLDFSMDNLSCNNPVISMLLKKFRVRYETDYCTALPGNYTTELLKLDEVAKCYKYMSLEVGTYTFELEFRTEFGVAICLAMTIEVEK